ncbi:MAG: Spy/CpxP family protein refolding chaperone [Pseudomonadota bacterium]
MKTVTTALLGGMMLVASASNAQPGGGFGFGPGMGGGFPGAELVLEHMADYLDLTDAQRDSIAAIVETVKPEAQALREQARSNRETMQALDVSDVDYDVVLNEVAISNGDLATQATLLFAEVRQEISGVLTPEQLEKLENARERRRDAGKSRFRRG